VEEQMIDYRAHAAAMQSVREVLATTAFGDPGLEQAQAEALADVEGNEGSAFLGAVVDHLLAHTSSDGSELELTRRAAKLWEDGSSLYRVLGEVRGGLEAALENPGNPGAADRFNESSMEAQRLAQRLHGLQAQITTLRDDIEPLPHLPPHPRQEDASIDFWDWGNLMLARRTDAFVRNLAGRASGPSGRAFAFGALAGYAANASGSPYLGNVVGGPRRAHRFRDRLARNTVGAWFGHSYPGLLSLSEDAELAAFGDPDSATALPSEIRTLLEDSLTATFDPNRAPPLPDLDLGYRRLVEHLQLLDRFRMPAKPDMPSSYFVAQLFADPSNPPPSLRPQSVGVTGDSGGGVGVGSSSPGTDTPGSDDSKKSGGELCAAIVALVILIVILLVVTLIKCIVKWADGKKCNYFEELGDTVKGLFEQDPPAPQDPPTTQDPQMTAQGLTAFAATEQAAQLVGHLWDLQQQMWEGLAQARQFLAKTGLIYPDEELLQNPGYSQFTSIPEIGAWPLRPEPEPESTYHLYPRSPRESPPETASRFEVGAVPSAFLATAGIPWATVGEIAVALWRQIAAGQQDSSNLDLDADRGYLHHCWAAAGSIDDEPLEVIVLGYGEL
jgi:hypothetical protein